MHKLDERFWYGATAVLTAVELYAIKHKHNNGTLSYAWRKACRTDSPLGRAGLYLGWGALSVWLLPHLCNQVESSVEAASETLSS